MWGGKEGTWNLNGERGRRVAAALRGSHQALVLGQRRGPGACGAVSSPPCSGDGRVPSRTRCAQRAPLGGFGARGPAELQPCCCPSGRKRWRARPAPLLALLAAVLQVPPSTAVVSVTSPAQLPDTVQLLPATGFTCLPPLPRLLPAELDAKVPSSEYAPLCCAFPRACTGAAGAQMTFFRVCGSGGCWAHSRAVAPVLSQVQVLPGKVPPEHPPC